MPRAVTHTPPNGSHAPPVEETIGVRISYATRFLRRRPEHLGGKRVALIAAHEPVWRFGVALAVEHDRWIVTQGGYFDDMPGSGDAAYLEFARTLAAPEIAECGWDAVSERSTILPAYTRPSPLYSYPFWFSRPCPMVLPPPTLHS